ncbi:NAD-binding protein [Olivibacter sitiensis]|uniref:NAD-binding protein n=1 Tax=Olivibacter sitiensis TaxID=376470 RepID=UPI00042A4CBF|nr:NAD-binding protein [Olivibacter sitiensis]
MSSAPSSPIKIHPLIIFASILIVFILGCIGYSQLLDDHFSLWGALYAVTLLFFLHHADAEIHNVYLFIAEFLAAIIFLFGIFALTFTYLHKHWQAYKISNFFKGHTVLIPFNHITRSIAKQLIDEGKKVVFVDDHASISFSLKRRQKRAQIIHTELTNEKIGKIAALKQASACIIATPNDTDNIRILSQSIAFLHPGKGQKPLKLQVLANDTDNNHVLKDYFDIMNEHEHYDLETFNIHQLAAKRIYDQYPPHHYLDLRDREEEFAIAVFGFTKTTEYFLLENIILSHYPEMGNLKIYLVDQDAETCLNHFSFKYPYYNEYIELIPVKLLNSVFYANFTWSKKDIEKLSKAKVMYMFGERDAALLTAATSFRQFYYAQTLNISQAPIVMCVPESNELIALINKTPTSEGQFKSTFNKHLNIQTISLISDTCTAKNLLEETATTDLMARVINYFFSVKYEFEGELCTLYPNLDLMVTRKVLQKIQSSLLDLPHSKDHINEEEIEAHVIDYLSGLLSIPHAELDRHFSINKRWSRLTNRKKDSNRYAARQVKLKIHLLQQMGCKPINQENILHFFPKLAPMEHKRWSAEKMVFNFKYGSLKEPHEDAKILKDILKIHDQLIPYEKLSDREKEKDINMFLLIPLLQALIDH